MDIRDFRMDFFDLTGRSAIVTGGNTGLGQAFSLALAKGGANVFVPSLADDDGTTRSLIEGEGVRYEFLQADITAPGVPAQVVGECVSRLGSVDILVNSAGICPLGEVLEFGRDKWDPTIAVNLTAAFEMSHEAAKHMIRSAPGRSSTSARSSRSSAAGCRPPTRRASTASPGSPRRTATSSPSTTSR